MSDKSPLAHAIATAHLEDRLFHPQGWKPASRAEANEVQAEALKLLGQKPCGFKIGAWPEGGDYFAPIPEDRRFASGDRITLRRQTGLELEVGWLLIAPLPPRETPDFAAALRKVVRPLLALELVAPRVAEPEAADLYWRLADFQHSDGVLLGAPNHDWAGEDFGALEASFRIDDLELPTQMQVPGGSAWATLLRFVDLVGTSSGGFQVGQVLITGTLHPILRNAPTGNFRAEIAGLGKLEAQLIRAEAT